MTNEEEFKRLVAEAESHEKSMESDCEESECTDSKSELKMHLDRYQDIYGDDRPVNRSTIISRTNRRGYYVSNKII